MNVNKNDSNRLGHTLHSLGHSLNSSLGHALDHSLNSPVYPQNLNSLKWKDLTILKLSMVPPGSRIISVQPGLCLPYGAIPISLTMEERIAMASLVPQFSPIQTIPNVLVPGLRMKVTSVKEPIPREVPSTTLGSIFSATEKEDSEYSTLDSDIQIQLS